MSINNLNEVEEQWGVSGIEDVKAYKKIIEVNHIDIDKNKSISNAMFFFLYNNKRLI